MQIWLKRPPLEARALVSGIVLYFDVPSINTRPALAGQSGTIKSKPGRRRD
jgi:hypothetical protein